MDKLYWNEYYKKNNKVMQPSNFAEFAISNMVKKSILDVGCGNGRDSLYFATNGFDVTAVDMSEEGLSTLRNEANLCNLRIKTINDDFTKDNFTSDRYDYIYSRFSMHAITEHEQNNFIRNIKRYLKEDGKIFIEARTTKDELYGKGEKVGKDTFLYNNHCRRFINFLDIQKEISNNGLNIIYAKEQNNWAINKNDNPIVFRIIAENK